MRKTVVLAISLVLIMSLAAFAQGTAAKKPTAAKTKAAPTHQLTGTISSVEASSLALSHKVKGKEETTNFMMNDQTKKSGELKAGERATVHYMVENGQDVATSVTVSAAKAAPKK